MLRHTLLLTPLFLLLTSCSSIPLSGSVDNNRYVSPDHTLSVEVPKLFEVQTHDGQDSQLHYVDFTSSYGWMADHAFSVQWFSAPNMPESEVLGKLPEAMKCAFETGDAKLTTTPRCQFVTLKGVRASQCVAEGMKNEFPAGFQATGMIVHGQLIFVYLLYPPAKPRPDSSRLIQSIKVK